MNYSRRDYLGVITVGATCLAGCASSAEDEMADVTDTMEATRTTATTEETSVTGTTEAADQQSLVEIPKITVQNLHREPHRFHVLILEGETPVFWRSYRAEAAEWEDGWVEKATGTVWKDPLSGPGEYSVHARIDDQEEWKSWRSSEDSRSCVYLEPEVEPSGRFYLEVGFPC